jgi:hypothetical protein
MQVAEGLEWLRIPWVRGALPKGVVHKNGVWDAPCLGWQGAFVMRGEKRSTIFCPYSMESFVVPNTCSELTYAKEPDGFNRDWGVQHLTDKWAQFQGFGFQKAYDVAAVVLRKLDAPVPKQTLKGGEMDDRDRGGKPAADELTKPVKRASKRGKFLAWLLENEGPKPVREIMAEFGMTRSNALSYLYMLNKDHGLGYSLRGDDVEVFLPDGCESPFDEEEEAWLD